MDFKMFNFLKFIESEYFGQCGNADLKYARIFWSKRIEHKISPSKIIHIFTIQTILNGLFYHANVSIRNTFLSLLRFPVFNRCLHLESAGNAWYDIRLYYDIWNHGYLHSVYGSVHDMKLCSTQVWVKALKWLQSTAP